MNWELVGEAKVIFESVLDSPIETRPALLDQFCLPGSALRQGVDALLAIHESQESFLNTSLPDLLSTASRSPRFLGGYEILRPLGAGGMAKVYLAKRTDGLHEQQVALKVIDRVISTAETDVRIQREVRALSKLAHPNIVRLLDGGLTDDGLFYMVMEYVPGAQIDAYCRDRSLRETEKLRVFLSLCDAVSYAHRNLIIHRDIKPSNVLVMVDGTLKLLDFGVAKLLDEEPGDRLTIGNRLTLEYASPEQLRADGAVSTASDVYSLGVLLYELLVGRPPYRFRGSLPHQIVATILEDEPVAPKLSGELSAIVLMALRKESERRYASVDYLKDDIERYLAGLPVKAFRDGVVYRFSKFVRRRKKLVAGVALASMAVLIAAGIAIYHANKANRRFEDVRLLADTVLSETQTKLWGVRGALAARVYVQKMGVDFLERLLADSPNDKALNDRLLFSLLMQAGTLSDRDGASVGDTAGARRALERARGLAEAQWRKAPGDASNVVRLAQVDYYLGKNLIERGEQKKARAAFERAVQLQADYHRGSTAFEAQENFAYAMSLLGHQCAFDGDRELSLRYHEKALRIREANVQSALSKADWLIEKRRRDVSGALYLLAESQHVLGLHTEALSSIERSIAIEQQLQSLWASNIVTRYLLAKRLLLKAQLELADHSLTVARQTSEQALSILREVSDDEKASWRYVRDVAVALGVVAAVCEAQGERETAILHLKEQLDLTSSAAAKDPESATARREREQCGAMLQRLTGVHR